MQSSQQLTDWLRRAHAMELGLAEALKAQAQNPKLEMTFRQEITLHLAETKEHAAAIEECVQSFGAENISTQAARVAFDQNALTVFPPGDSVGDVVLAYSRAHFQIAFYQALQAAAEGLAENSVSELCNAILPDEERMAAWLKENLSIIVGRQLRGDAAPSEPQAA